ncbi:hypothetical protein, partial [Pseudomonas syringae]|uniref:hypothetical protein n=1 Tax=Pseudomonas syringae TaxID=317 RepID=UPI001E4EEDF9
MHDRKLAQALINSLQANPDRLLRLVKLSNKFFPKALRQACLITPACQRRCRGDAEATQDVRLPAHTQKKTGKESYFHIFV